MASGSGGSLPSFIARRLLISVLLLFLISLGIFSLILIMPGNPAVALAGGTKATPAEIAKITKQLHLNQGFFAQYWRWLSGAVHGNLGQSLFQNESVTSGIAARFPVTFAVAAGGMVIAILLGLPAGIISGIRQGTVRDRAVTIGSSIAVAIPDFWLGILLVIIFAVKLGWLPALGYTPFTQSPFECRRVKGNHGPRQAGPRFPRVAPRASVRGRPSPEDRSALGYGRVVGPRGSA